MIFARKKTVFDHTQLREKNPEFYMIFARKMPEFYTVIARKIFSRILGARAPLPPVSYAPRVVLTSLAKFVLLSWAHPFTYAKI